MRIKTIALLIFILTAFLSCDNDGVKVNTLVVAVPEEAWDEVNAVFNWTGISSRLFYSTLLAYDEKFSIVNDLALSYKISPDRLTWTVNIRLDARFNNRRELNAKDVVYSFMTAKKIDNWLDLSMLEKAEAYDAGTVIFTLNRPDMSFIHSLATLGIIKEGSVYSDTNEIPTGSGPYKFVSRNEQQEIVIEENSFYYGKKPAIKRILFLMTNEETAYRYAREGKVDVLPVPISRATQIIDGTRLVSLGSVEKIAVFFPLKAKTVGFDNVVTGNDVTSQKSIRQAIDRAVNRDNIVAGILGGYGSPAYGPADGFPWDEPAGRLVSGRVRTAKSILATDGWRDLNSDGILEKNGIEAEFSLYYPENDIIAQSTAIAVANVALEAGIKIDAEGKKKEELPALMRSNAVIFTWGSRDMFELYRLFHSSNNELAAHPNFYNNPVVDLHLDRAKQSATYDAALMQIKQAQWDGKTGVSMKGDSPIVWLASRSNTYFVNERIVVGNSRLERRGFGWPILGSLLSWSWKEE